jgi:serine/threonine protein phosphatase PrpC
MTIASARHAVATDPGKRRRRNEDAYVVEPPLFAVADGMGGAQAGEIAARIAAGALRESPDRSGEEAVVELIKEANRRVYEAAAGDEARSGMGTTITAALVEGDRVQIGHVGDSRAYRIREGRLEQLTEDHSLVAELVRSGRLSPEEADTHPQRSVITRTVGTDPDVDVDTFSVDARPGDVFVLCSDGLTTMVSDEAILDLVERNRAGLDKAAKALVDAANKGGGEDNITIVLFEIGEDGGGATETTDTLPAVEEPAEVADEETLSGLEGVPTINDTRMLSRDELEALASTGDRGGRHHSRVSRTAVIIGSTTLVVVLAALVVWTLSRSYFVGAEKNGRIAVYQGFPWNIAGGVRLYRLRYESPVLAGELSQAERRRLFGHDLRSYGSALAAVKEFEAEVVP